MKKVSFPNSLKELKTPVYVTYDEKINRYMNLIK